MFFVWLYILALLWPLWVPLAYAYFRGHPPYGIGVASAIGILSTTTIIFYVTPYLLFYGCDAWDIEGRCGLGLSLERFTSKAGFDYASILSFFLWLLFSSSRKSRRLPNDDHE